MQIMKKISLLLLALVLTAGILLISAPEAQAATYSGTCGENLSWVIESKVLTISGQGNMNDYDLYYSDRMDFRGPWAKYTYNQVIIEKGAANIGECAFGSGKMTSVTIGDGVVNIGYSAFYNCSKLTEITIPATVVEIGDCAFWYCTSLTDVYYGGTEEQWAAINILGDNEALTNATIHFTEAEPEVETLAIVTQPADQTAANGETAQFTVEATGAASYAWQYRKSGGSWCTTKLSGFDTDTLSVEAASHRNGYQYRCRLTGEDGSVLYTEPVTLTVSSCITAQPEDRSSTVGGVAQFSVQAQNVAGYQWQYRKSGGSWCTTKLSGFDTDTLSVDAAAHRDGYQYRCKLTLTDGSVIYTDIATLTVWAF